MEYCTLKELFTLLAILASYFILSPGLKWFNQLFNSKNQESDWYKPYTLPMMSVCLSVSLSIWLSLQKWDLLLHSTENTNINFSVRCWHIRHFRIIVWLLVAFAIIKVMIFITLFSSLLCRTVKNVCQKTWSFF